MGSVFGQEFFETPEEGEKGRATDGDSEGEEGWVMDETYHAVCLKKDSFFLPTLPLVFEVTIHPSVQ